MDKTKEIEGKLVSSFDRFSEAHFWIHQLEMSYHFADPFRYHLNAFLKAIKEVPSLLSMELQNQEGFPDWFKDERRKLRENKLLSFLSEQRDFVVHRGMLVPKSHGGIGITEGRGVKMGFSLPINPLMDSDDAMDRYIFVISTDGKDPFNLLAEDDDSLPCVHREWKLETFDEELVELAAKAWFQTGETVRNVVRWLGGDPPELQLNCRHSTQETQFKMYDRKVLRTRLKELKKLRKAFAKSSGAKSKS